MINFTLIIIIITKHSVFGYFGFSLIFALHIESFVGTRPHWNPNRFRLTKHSMHEKRMSYRRCVNCIPGVESIVFIIHNNSTNSVISIILCMKYEWKYMRKKFVIAHCGNTKCAIYSINAFRQRYCLFPSFPYLQHGSSWIW